MEYRSIRFVSVLVMLVVILLLSDDSSARSGKWDSPCEPTSTRSGENGFATLVEHAEVFKSLSLQLKNEYVAARFANEEEAEWSVDWNSMHSIEPDWNFDSLDKYDPLMRRIYENLARLIVITTQTAKAEDEDDHKNEDFGQKFKDLLFKSNGLYSDLCIFFLEMGNRGITEVMTDETDAAIEAISLPAVSSAAQRHSRDYHVICVLQWSADELYTIYREFL